MVKRIPNNFFHLEYLFSYNVDTLRPNQTILVHPYLLHVVVGVQAIVSQQGVSGLFRFLGIRESSVGCNRSRVGR